MVKRMLAGQAAYGTHEATAAADGLAVGRRLFPLLPEDQFDTTIQSEGGRLLVADVRLDNRPELVDALGIRESDASQMPDSRLLLKCLLKWGEAGVERLAGEFAFAFWDPDRQALLMARDIMGFRPLHFHHGKSFLAFASMPSGLHAVPGIPYDFDEKVVAEHLAHLPYEGEASWFAGISRVLPGHTVRFQRQKIERSRYWSFPNPEPSRRRDYAEGLRHVFDEAVRSQLRGADAGVATHLSAGLDSSAVTATAARLFPGTVYAFTGTPRPAFDGVLPRGALGDESEAAALVARQFPNVTHIAVSGEGSPLDHLDSTFGFYQGPELHLCNAVWIQAINKAVRERGLRVLLIGDEGNLTISYSAEEYLPYLLRHGRIAELARLWTLMLRRKASLPTIGARTLSPFLPTKVWHAALALGRRPVGLSRTSINPDRLPGLRRRASELRTSFSGRSRTDPAEAREWVLSHRDSGNYVKGTLAQWGLSIRDPTADKRVIEYCMSVPPAEFIKDGVPRSLARRAFSDRLPIDTINSPVRGYQGADWYERLTPELARARAEVGFVERCSAASEVVSATWLKETLDNWPAADWGRPDVISRYRMGLLRGIAAGHFMRKVKGTN